MTEQTCLAQSQPLACQPTCLPPLGWRSWKAGSESLEPDGMVQVGRCPHTLSPGPGPQSRAGRGLEGGEGKSRDKL